MVLIKYTWLKYKYSTGQTDEVHLDCRKQNKHKIVRQIHCQTQKLFFSANDTSKMNAGKQCGHFTTSDL